MDKTIYLKITMLLAFVLAYLIGSIPFAIVISKIMGIADPRTFGSGNPGATNVLRSGNKLAAFLVLLFDTLKGSVAVLLIGGIGDQTSPIYAIVAMLGVFLGHVFSIFLKFKGGKGVATALGVMLGFCPLAGLAALGMWLIIALSTGYSSLAAILTAVAAPFLYLIIYHHQFVPMAFWAITIMALVLIYRHRANIRRLCDGTEGNFRKKPQQPK